MQQQISINLTHDELSALINSAVSEAIQKNMAPADADTLLTVDQACKYLKCSDVFLWKLRKAGKIASTNAGKKILVPKSSIDKYLNLKQVA